MEQKIEETELRLLSVDEACERLGISRCKLYELIYRHLLKSVKIDKRRLISNRAIEECVDKLEQYGA